MTLGLSGDLPPPSVSPPWATSTSQGFPSSPTKRPQRSEAALASAAGQLTGRGALPGSAAADGHRHCPRGLPNPRNNASGGVLSSLGGRTWAQSGGMRTTNGYTFGAKQAEPRAHFLEDIQSMQREGELASQRLERDWASRSVPSLGNFSSKRCDFDPYQREEMISCWTHKA